MSHTKFSDLPETVQINILDKVTWNDFRDWDNESVWNSRRYCHPVDHYEYNRLRQVNHEWLKLVMALNRTRIRIDDDLTLATFTTNNVTKYVGELEVKNIYDQPLPIVSSTEMDLPEAECLTLSGEISLENICKLLQYYVVNCSSLRFAADFLFYFNPDQIPGGFQFDNITTLEIEQPDPKTILDNSLYRYERLEREKHLQNFIDLLMKTDFPMLRNMILNLNHRNPKLDWRWTPNIGYLSRLVLEGFNTFFKKYGQQMRSFNIRSGLYYLMWPWIIEYLQHFINLRRLEVRVNAEHGEYNSNNGNYRPLILKPERAEKLNSLRMLTTLKLDIIGTKGEVEIVQILLANNSKSLNTFNFKSLQQKQSRLDKIYSIWDLHLTEIYSIGDGLRVNQLSMVKYLTFDYKLCDILESDIDRYNWRENITNWIVQIFPNLKELDIKVYLIRDEPWLFEMEHISTLIESLPYLTQIKITSDDYKKKNLVSIDAEEWILTNYPKSFPILGY